MRLHAPASRLTIALALAAACLALLSPAPASSRAKGKRAGKAVPTVQSRCGDLLKWDAAVRASLAELEAAPARWPAGPAIDRVARALPGIVELGAIARRDPAVTEEVRVAGERLDKVVASLQEPMKRKHAPLVGPALRRLADSFDVIRPGCERLPGAEEPAPEPAATP